MSKQESIFENPGFLIMFISGLLMLTISVTSCVGGVRQDEVLLEELRDQGCETIVKEYRTGKPVCARKDKS